MYLGNLCVCPLAHASTLYGADMKGYVSVVGVGRVCIANLQGIRTEWFSQQCVHFSPKLANVLRSA